jgi:hypothetical protein
VAVFAIVAIVTFYAVGAISTFFARVAIVAIPTTRISSVIFLVIRMLGGEVFTNAVNPFVFSV